MGIFDKLRHGLEKTKKSLGGRFEGLFAGGRLGDEFYEELEEVLVLADVGAALSASVSDELRSECKKRGIKDASEARGLFRDIMAERLERAGERSLALEGTPAVILVIGVNGVGKTTTIGKLAYMLKEKRVLLCAGDTFRAAAAEQLAMWAGRSGADIIKQEQGADAAAVVYDAIAASRARKADILIIDTAGRLHNKQNLMNELGKIAKIIDRELPGVKKEILLVLDAVTGQNGLSQAKQFAGAAGVTGVVLTKLDGTAKGGIVFAVTEELGVPVKLAGCGESEDDLVPFEPRAFVEAIY